MASKEKDNNEKEISLETPTVNKVKRYALPPVRLGEYVIYNYPKHYTPVDLEENIHPWDVVRPDNYKYTIQESPEVNSWRLRTNAGCPTYGSCMRCFGSGPVSENCVDCIDRLYEVVMDNT